MRRDNRFMNNVPWYVPRLKARLDDKQNFQEVRYLNKSGQAVRSSPEGE